MFKKIISVFCMFFGILTAAHAGPAANVEYVHQMINHVWGIEIPYNPELKNPKFAANMEYLLAAVDVANEVLNGYKTTDYKSDPTYATKYIADTFATNKAVYELIKMYYPFNMHIKPTDSNKTFNFNIAARGKFYVDWGDGTRETIDLTDINLSNSVWSGDSRQISHTYSSAGEYTVSLGGYATEYETYDWVTDDYSTLSHNETTFYTESKILVGVSGHLGRVFPTLKDGSNPNFAGGFMYSGLQSVGADLFKGITGKPTPGMFAGLFYMCNSLTTVPSGLFKDLDGSTSLRMFENMFYDSALTQIPDGMFAGLDKSQELAELAFYSTFRSCDNLTGPSAQLDGWYLYKIWPNVSDFYTYSGATGLSDYPCIPTSWGGLGTGTDCKIENVIVESTTRPDVAEWPFEMKTVDLDDGGAIGIGLALVGDVYIDWGDGNYTTINMMGDYQSEEIVHEYAAGEYTIKIAASPRKYFSGMDWTTFYVWHNESLASIDGSLGRVFPTLSNGSNPCFAYAFADAVNLTGEIPADLFDGIHGQPNDWMYAGLFFDSGVSGTIPDGLFGELSGEWTEGLFESVFAGCTGLTGEIPADLFAGLTGDLPDFAFNYAFEYCAGLTGPSAKIGNKYLYEIWPDATEDQVEYMYSGATGLSDWCQIPGLWRGGTSLSCVIQDDMGQFSADINIKEDYRRNVGFNLRAAGRFIIDWGDGTVEEFINTDEVFDDSVAVRREHEYAEVGEYTITIAGLATQYVDMDPFGEYLPSAWEHTFNFYGIGDELVGVSGKIGSVFPTLADGSNPNFGGLFSGAQIETVPADLFDGIHGQASFAMFAGMFMESKIKEIPGGLFDGITGSSNHMFYGFCEGCKNLDTVSGDVFKFANDLEPTSSMFYGVFNQSSLKGIPAGLFDDVVGEAAEQMFFRAFKSCSELTGEIPAGLFAGISGTPKDDMFRETFSGDSGLTGEIPDDLFGDISGTLSQWGSFSSMFGGCTGLTGPSAKIDGTLLYEIWPDATSNQVGGMYSGCTGLTDYADIPAAWK